jgi:hypothetical protein
MTLDHFKTRSDQFDVANRIIVLSFSIHVKSEIMRALSLRHLPFGNVKTLFFREK